MLPNGGHGFFSFFNEQNSSFPFLSGNGSTADDAAVCLPRCGPRMPALCPSALLVASKAAWRWLRPVVWVPYLLLYAAGR